MQRKDLNAKISPEAMQTILLDEISGRLADLNTEIRSQAPKGDFYSLPVLVGTDGQQVTIFYSVTLYNDGNDDIYVLKDYNRSIDFSSDAPLHKGESIAIDMKRQTTKNIWLKTPNTTAFVRIFKLD